MLQLRIEDTGTLTKLLFLGEAFDRFLVREAHFETGITVDLDGTLNGGFFDSDEEAALPDPVTASWGAVRPLCFQIVKGKNLPKRFRIVFRLAESDVPGWIAANGLSAFPAAVNGLFLTLRYENLRLFAVSGISLSAFTPDRSAEQAWDRSVSGFFRRLGIAASAE